MRIVLDASVLLASIGSRNSLLWLFDALIEGRFVLIVSTPILLEYEEVIARMTTADVANGVLRAIMVLPTVEPVAPRFRWCDRPAIQTTKSSSMLSSRLEGTRL